MGKRGFIAGAVLCLVFAAGCATGQIEVVKDDFKNTSMVKMELNHYAGLSIKGNAIYTREFAAGKASAIIVNYAFTTAADAANLESKCMIKADDSVFDCSFADITGEIQTTVSQNNMAGGNAFAMNQGMANNAGFVDYSKPAGTGVQVQSHSNKIFRTKLMIPAGAEKGILSANKLAMRVYFGTDAATFNIDGADLQKIKDFIQSTPDKIVTTAPKASASAQPKY